MRVSLQPVLLALTVCLPIATAAQDMAEQSLLFDADTRTFVLQTDDTFDALGSEPILNWTAEGLNPQDALDLNSLMSNPTALSFEEAQRLETLTQSASVRFQRVEDQQVVVPVVPDTTGGPVVVPVRQPQCPDGTTLPQACDGVSAPIPRICRCSD